MMIILRRVCKKNLTLNCNKCCYNQKRIEFFRHLFRAESVSPDPKKSQLYTLLRNRQMQKKCEVF